MTFEPVEGALRREEEVALPDDVAGVEERRDAGIASAEPEEEEEEPEEVAPKRSSAAPRESKTESESK